ncbi:MAG: hypothetical protein ACR5LF_01005 [Symbiopectobacterium sp.]
MAFSRYAPQEFSYRVEVCHLAFFAKGEDERQLNQGLAQRAIDRIMFDNSRYITRRWIRLPCGKPNEKKTAFASSCTADRTAIRHPFHLQTICAGLHPGLIN